MDKFLKAPKEASVVDFSLTLADDKMEHHDMKHSAHHSSMDHPSVGHHHMDHNDMHKEEMGAHSSHHMPAMDHMMKMYFHGGYTEVILFDFWRINSIGKT